MWFLLGVVTVVVASLALAWGNGRPWRGQEALGDVRYSLLRTKGSVVGLEVGAPTMARVEFEVAPEGRFDRWAKRIGLSVEGQVGVDAFDRALYLVADDPQVVTLLRHDRAAVDALLALFTEPPNGVTAVRRVTCRGGQLSVRASCRAKTDEARAIAGGAVGPLLTAARALDAVAKGALRPDPLRWRSTLVASVAYGLLASGVAHGMRLGLTSMPNTIDDGALALMAAPVALVALALLVGATVVLLGRTSRAHLVLAHVLLAGAPGAYLTALTEVRDFNIEADTAPAHEYATTVLSARKAKSGKGATTYSVTLDGWPGHAGPLRLEVKYGVYLRSFTGMPVTVRVHDGALGLAWLESFEPTR